MDIFQTIAADESRMIKITGGVQTGKTQALLLRAAELISSGTAPEQIFIVTSTGFAATAARKRLVSILEEAGQSSSAASSLANRVRIGRVAEICKDILGTPEAIEATGRTPKVLNNAEYKFILEDMKTTGAQNRKLRNHLRLFQREWAGLEPESVWLSPGEATDIFNVLRRKLTHTNSMLSEELAFICANYLQSEQGSPAGKQFSHVLVDDFQNLSKAEQRVACLCANTQVIVAGNPNQCVSAFSAYPYPEGFTSFDTLRHNVSCYKLEDHFGNPHIIACARALSQVSAMEPGIEAPLEASGAPGNAVLNVKWNTPTDELNGATKFLRKLLDESAHEAKTYIVVPNKAWRRSALTICKQRGFKTDTTGCAGGLGGDPRESEKAPALVAYAKLALLADPAQAFAWRMWCGFDNYLLNSDAWMHLEDYADERKIDIIRALDWVLAAHEADQDTFLRSDVLAKRYKEGKEFIAANSRRKGFALLRAIGAEKLPEFANLSKRLVGDEDAATVYALLTQELDNPQFTDDEHALRFIDLNNLTGLEADNIIILGAVNGFLPPRDAFEVVSTDEERQAIMDASRREFYSGIAKAHGMLFISYFGKADLELAERTKMQVARIRSEAGARIALVRPTCFLEEMGHATPGTTGGEQLLADIGLE